MSNQPSRPATASGAFGTMIVRVEVRVIDAVLWWLVATLIGVAALPYAYRFFRFLPDRGIAFARPLGLLLVGYVLWLGAFSGALPNTGGTAVVLVAVLAAGGVWLAGRDRAALLPELRGRLWYIVAVELVFLLFFAGATLLRAYAPDIDGTEKPFESAFFQAVLRSETFGPRDPWYGGEPMSYYYFGYVLLGVVTQIAHTAPEVAFNLGLGLTGGMAAAGAFGLAYNLVVARGRFRVRATLAAALLAPLFLLIVSNLEGVFELLAIHGVDAGWFYRAIAIENLSGPKESAAWYPTEHWWWWRATRLGSSWNVQEFPFFSFLLGDLHAHVMVLPYSLTMLAAIVGLWRTGEPLDGGFLRRHPWLVAGVALLAGGLYVTNAWDFPTALVLLGLVVLARNYALAGRPSLRPLIRSAIFLIPVAVFAVLLYLPFYIGFTAAPTELRVTEVLHTEDFIERHAVATPPFQFFVFWGPLLFPALSYLLWRARSLRPWRLDPALLLLGLAAGVLPVLFWLFAVLGARGPGGLIDEVQARGHLLLTWCVLIPVVILAALVLLAEVFRPGSAAAGGTRVFVAAGMLMALLLILFPELFFIIDIVVLSRHNTVFKFYYTAWLLLSVTGAAGLADLIGAWREQRASARDAVASSTRSAVTPFRAAWLAGGLVLFALALVYPVTATFARSEGFGVEPTLDGLRGARRFAPDEYEAALWLRSIADGGMPVVLEAEGPDYSLGGRVSARTGLPTIVGWPNHEWQERGALAPVLARVNDVAALYRTDDPALARDLLDRYNVAYVYIGGYERQRYGAAAGDTLARLGRLVFDRPTVQIYAIDPSPGPSPR
jgi:YYY domain-containing protein